LVQAENSIMIPAIMDDPFFIFLALKMI